MLREFLSRSVAKVQEAVGVQRLELAVHRAQVAAKALAEVRV